MAPCIALFDEVEKVFAGMGGGGDASDGGVKRGVFGKVLTWMNDQSGVFVIATANDVQGLLSNAPEFVRKGRFDELFFVDLPNVKERAEIATIHIARRFRDPALFDLSAIAEASVGLSGVEIEDAVKAALRTSYTDGIRELCTADVIAAIKATVPLSRTSSMTINQLRDWAKGRCVPATPPEECVVNEGDGDTGLRNLDLPVDSDDPALS
jgi:SpoVK/Ycf46/Vps4 family AAA+-type ATPase